MQASPPRPQRTGTILGTTKTSRDKTRAIPLMSPSIISPVSGLMRHPLQASALSIRRTFRTMTLTTVLTGRSRMSTLAHSQPTQKQVYLRVLAGHKDPGGRPSHRIPNSLGSRSHRPHLCETSSSRNNYGLLRQSSPARRSNSIQIIRWRRHSHAAYPSMT